MPRAVIDALADMQANIKTAMYVYVYLVGLQPSLSENASVAIKSPLERMQTFLSSAHESRWSILVSRESVV